MDPSMLIAFLIQDLADWRTWRTAVESIRGKGIVRVSDAEGVATGHGVERMGAVDEVESFDEEDGDEEDDGDLVSLPPSSLGS